MYPPGDYAEILAAELVAAVEEPEAADALGITHGDGQLIRRQRVRYRGLTAVSVSMSWFDGSPVMAQLCPRLLVRERIVEGTAAYVAQRTGRRLVERRDLVSATSADKVVLDLPAGTPLLSTRSWFLDSGGGVIEYGYSNSIPGRVLTYKCPVPPSS